MDMHFDRMIIGWIGGILISIPTLPVCIMGKPFILSAKNPNTQYGSNACRIKHKPHLLILYLNNILSNPPHSLSRLVLSTFPSAPS